MQRDGIEVTFDKLTGLKLEKEKAGATETVEEKPQIKEKQKEPEKKEESEKEDEVQEEDQELDEVEI